MQEKERERDLTQGRKEKRMTRRTLAKILGVLCDLRGSG
jgi:hypothetical protein